MSTLEQVQHRALALKGVIVHALSLPPLDEFQSAMRDMPPKEVEETLAGFQQSIDNFWAMMKESGYYDYLSPEEKEFVEGSLLGISPYEQVRFSWRIEAYQMLLWALNLIDEIPAWNVMADHEILQDIKAEDLRAVTTLRSDDQIASARDGAEMWHWRSRTRQLFEGPDAQAPPEGADMKSLLADAAAHAVEQGFATEIVDGDIGVGGVPYRDLAEDDWQLVTSISVERHFALNWLCGYGDSWDETPTDT